MYRDMVNTITMDYEQYIRARKQLIPEVLLSDPDLFLQDIFG